MDEDATDNRRKGSAGMALRDVEVSIHVGILWNYYYETPESLLMFPCIRFWTKLTTGIICFPCRAMSSE